MARIANIHGGGYMTNSNGLHFEQETSLDEALIKRGYFVRNNKVYRGMQLVGISAGKYNLYKKILEPNGIDYKQIISKRMLPDEAFYNCCNNTVYVIEKKFQSGSGSVDEKIQTCDFKKKQYNRLFAPLNIRVEYIYVLNDWFKRSEYKDALNYIESVGCYYFYNKIPLELLGL